MDTFFLYFWELLEAKRWGGEWVHTGKRDTFNLFPPNFHNNNLSARLSVFIHWCIVVHQPKSKNKKNSQKNLSREKKRDSFGFYTDAARTRRWLAVLTSSDRMKIRPSTRGHRKLLSASASWILSCRTSRRGVSGLSMLACFTSFSLLEHIAFQPLWLTIHTVQQTVNL